MTPYKFTAYFENEVLRKRRYLKTEWCIRVLDHPLRSEPQEKNRYRFWGRIEELEGRVLRVVTPRTKSPSTMPSLTEDSSHEAQLLSGHGFPLH
jgi:hypothetical protein